MREGYWVTARIDVGRTLHRVSNPVVTAVLRSRCHKLLSGSAAVLTVTGRRSGRSYQLPVQYAADGQTVYVLPGGWQHKIWWRNLIAPAKVRLLLRGRDVTGIGQAFSGDREPQLVAAAMNVYLTRFPTSARVRGIGRDASGRPDPGQLQRAVRDEVIIRLVLDPPGPGPALGRAESAGCSFPSPLTRAIVEATGQDGFGGESCAGHAEPGRGP